MALRTDSKSLYDQILIAEEVRNRRYRKARDIIRQYHTGAYDGRDELDDPENHAFEYISLVVPQIINDNPLCLISGAEEDKNVAALQAATNRWSRWNNIRNVGIQLAIDQCIAWGVARITPGPVPGWTPGEVNADGTLDIPQQPRLERIPPGRFAIDPVDQHPRYTVLLHIMDKADLLDRARRRPEEGWNATAVAELSTGDDVNKHRPEAQGLVGLDRQEVAFYEVWVPEIDLPESPGARHGFYGTRYTISTTQGRDGAVEIRKPQPQYGSRQGEFVVFGTHHVPERTYPVSTLYATLTQNRDLNAHGRAIRNAAARKKRLALGDALQSADAKRINDAADGTFLLVKGLDTQKVTDISLGGIDEGMMFYRNFARGLLDMASGTSEALHGNTNPNVSATADAIAANALATRIGFAKSQYLEGMRQCFERAAQIIYNDPRVEIALGDGDIYFGGHGLETVATIKRRYPNAMIDPELLTKTFMQFEEMEITIDVSSMERLTQEKLQRNVTMVGQFYATMLPLAAQFPYAAPWEQMFRRFARAYGEPSLGDVNPIAARAAMFEAAEKGISQSQAGSSPNMLSEGGGGLSIGLPQGGAERPQSRMEKRVEKAGTTPKTRPTVAKGRNT